MVFRIEAQRTQRRAGLTRLRGDALRLKVGWSSGCIGTRLPGLVAVLGDIRGESRGTNKLAKFDSDEKCALAVTRALPCRTPCGFLVC